VLAAWQPASITIEPVRVQIVRLEIPIHRLTAWAGGSAARRRLDDDQRRLFFLGYLGRRQPGLLQGSQLAEERLL
jgi:hypothetical protein